MDTLDARRRSLLQTVGVGAAGVAGLAAAGLTWASATGSLGPARSGGPMRTLSDARPWLNTEPLQAQDLAGKIVLINFWTYSCINSLRPLPYLLAWARKYKDRGLVVIGVHTPEFGFEHDIDRVRRATSALGIGYPVVLDNEYAIWRAFENQAWPGFYFVDARGAVRDRKLGEGGYDQSERLIQRLLSQAGGDRIDDEITDIFGEGVQAAPDWSTIRSPETYIGYANASNFVGRNGFTRDAPADYEATPNLSLNHWSLSGSWIAGREFAVLAEPTGAIKLRFHARDLNLVLGRSPQASPVRYRVTIDGAATGDHHGVDTDAEGRGVVEEDRMYQLVRQHRAIEHREFEVSFLDAGVRAYVFTFG